MNVSTTRNVGAAPATLRLGQFAASLKGDALPRDIKTTLGELFLDYVRVASIGAGMPWSAWADAYMASLGGQGNAAVLFRTGRRDAVRAAFLNATYAGSIDADDTHVGGEHRFERGQSAKRQDERQRAPREPVDQRWGLPTFGGSDGHRRH